MISPSAQPWLLQIRTTPRCITSAGAKDREPCSGVLIHQQFVLTSATCLLFERQACAAKHGAIFDGVDSVDPADVSVIFHGRSEKNGETTTTMTRRASSFSLMRGKGQRIVPGAIPYIKPDYFEDIAIVRVSIYAIPIYTINSLTKQLVFKLQEPVTLSNNVRTICIPQKFRPKAGKPAIFSSFGGKHQDSPAAGGVMKPTEKMMLLHSNCLYARTVKL